MPRSLTICLPDVMPGERLVPEAAGFKAQGFVLSDDLDHLVLVHTIGAPEATVFYCTRILEMLVAAALRRVGLEPSENPCSNLELLEYINLISRPILYLAHELRRTGNAVRHLRRRLVKRDADVAIAFLEPCLEWFFCAFRYGDKLPNLTRNGEHLGLSVAPELQPVIAAFSRARFREEEALAALSQEECRAAFAATPTIAALQADLLLSRGRRDEALEVINSATSRFPDDLRLGQLRGLCHRRMKKLEEAAKILTEVREQNPDDEETLGILAAVHKERWLREGDRESLEQAHRLYLRGWHGKKRKKAKISPKQNTWLGINAATTANWLHLEEEATDLATAVKTALEQRQGTLAGKTCDPYVILNYWDQVTLAEAELLLGNDETARRIYHDAFARYADRTDDISVTCKQARAIRPELALAYRCVMVGVTGHRQLPNDEALREQTREMLGQVKQIAAGCEGSDAVGLVVLSSLAEGADRLMAEVVLEQEAGSLQAVLPLEPADYESDFATEESRLQFRGLLERAKKDVTVVPVPAGAPDPRTAAYAAAGRAVVDRCDVLIALWDGEPTRGPGGTAEIVEYARQLGKPLVWCQISPSGGVIKDKERMEQLVPRRGPHPGDRDKPMYKPDPIDTSHVTLPADLLALVERLAENAHDVWAHQRMAEGWTYGAQRNDQAKNHPDLVPYADLSEPEKEYDRSMALQTIKAMVGLGYRIGMD